jgi:LSD1 subclass zinc finger protein
MDETQLRLDGNAAAGMLREVFVHELTTARGACASCGAIAHIGSQHLYMYPLSPGAVLRCSTCQAVLMVFAHTGDRIRVGMPGLTWLEMVNAVDASTQA